VSPAKRSSRRRLLCVFQHAPTPGAPGLGYRQRLYLAELVRRGWHVDLVSTPVNYMTGEIPAPYARRLLKTEELEGIRHHWVWALPHIHRSRLRRALNYVSFSATATARALTLPRPDVILASSPPLSVGTVGATLAARFRRPWVLEIRDPWPEGAAAAGWLEADSAAYRLLARLSRRYESGAASVLLPTPGLADDVRSHGARDVVVATGIVADRPVDEAARERLRQELGAGDRCLFTYVGAHGVANGLDMLLDAAADVPRDSSLFVLVGEGSDRDRLRRRVDEEGLTHVRMVGAVPKDRVDDYLAASDVCVHVLRPDPLFTYVLPNKILSYLEAHRPFVTNVAGLPERIAGESGGGFAATAPALARELRLWVEMEPEERRRRGEQARAYGLEHFRLETNVDRFEAMLERAIAGPG
jgi:glycosyltransferase involved in cell wall biosynthesis